MLDNFYETLDVGLTSLLDVSKLTLLQNKSKLFNKIFMKLLFYKF